MQGIKMKKLLIGFLVGLLALPTPGATLKVNVRNIVSENVKNRRVTLTLTQAGPAMVGPWLLAGDQVAQSTPENGIVWFSNVANGTYRLDVSGSPSRSFPLGIPDTNGILDFSEVVGGTNTVPVFYTAMQIDALIRTNGVTVAVGTNTVVTTNAFNNGVTVNLPTAPVFNGYRITNIAVAALTNAGTMAYSNASDFTAWVTNAIEQNSVTATEAITNNDTRAIQFQNDLGVNGSLNANFLNVEGTATVNGVFGVDGEVRFPANAISGYVWTVTNATTGAGGWQPGLSGSIPFSSISGGTNAVQAINPVTEEYKWIRATAVDPGVPGGGSESFNFWKSQDGIHWSTICKNFKSTYLPNRGATYQCFSPAVVYWSNRWFVAYDAKPFDSKLFSITSTTNFIDWATPTDITLSYGGILTGGLFAGRFFQDDDGSLYFTPGLYPNGTVWLTQVQNASMTSWLTPVRIINTNAVDGCIARTGSTYYAFANGASAGYRVMQYRQTGAITNADWECISTNVFGLTNIFEALEVRKMSTNNWRIYMMADLANVVKCYYSDSTNLLNWTTPLPIQEGLVAGGATTTWEVPSDQRYTLANLEANGRDGDIKDFTFTWQTTNATAAYSPAIPLGFGNSAKIKMFITAVSDSYQSAEWDLEGLWGNDFGSWTKIGEIRTNSIHRPSTAWSAQMVDSSLVTSPQSKGIVARVFGPASSIVTWTMRGVAIQSAMRPGGAGVIDSSTLIEPMLFKDGNRLLLGSNIVAAASTAANAASTDLQVIEAGANYGAQGSNSVVLGGMQNKAFGIRSMVGGGQSNLAIGNYSVVLGGTNNMALSNYSMVLGGFQNIASNNFAVVVGGGKSKALGTYSFIGGSRDVGGLGNLAMKDLDTIINGFDGQASGPAAFIGNGNDNWAYGLHATAINGQALICVGAFSSVVSGLLNRIGDDVGLTAHDLYSVIVGGHENVIEDTATNAAIIAGYQNNSRANYGTIVGGYQNTISDNMTNVFVIGSGWSATTWSNSIYIGPKGGSMSSIIVRPTDILMTNTILRLKGSFEMKGYRRGHVTRIDANGASATLMGDQMNNVGTSSAVVPTSTEGMMREDASDGTGNAKFGWSGNLNYRMGRNLYMAASIKLVQFSGSGMFVGFTENDTATQMGGTNVTGNWIGFICQSNATAPIRIACKNGTTQSFSATSDTIDANVRVYEIIIDDTSGVATFKINDVIVGTLNSNLPTSGTNLRYVAAGVSSDATTRRIRSEFMELQSDR